MDGQVTMEEYNPEYAAFVEKFKPKKTTDDCYTPENIYDAVRDWVLKEYRISTGGGTEVIRPFWPGGDYRRRNYPDGCVVIDNPPFSLRSEIVAFYMEHGVPFFLFSPSLTVLCGRTDVCAVITDSDITYENGAVVRTAFVTNLEKDCVLRTAPDLGRILRAEDELNRRKLVKELPKYAYPDEVLTAAIAQRWAHYGVEFRLDKRDCIFIRKLDAQSAQGKAIFGGGLLLSERAAAERAAAERAAAERAAAERAAAERAAAERAAANRWELSARERELIKHIGGRSL